MRTGTLKSQKSCHSIDMQCPRNIVFLLWLAAHINHAQAIRHGQNLIWAQVPSLKNSVTRLVGIEGDPDEWIPTAKVKIRHISAPQFGWEFSGLAFDYRTQTLLWSEAMNKRIQSLVLNGSTDTTDVFTGTSPKVYGLAVDWQSGNLYWTDGLYNWIVMAPVHSTDAARAYKIIVQTDLDAPHGIAVHTGKGLLIWSDYGVWPRIEVASLLGEGRRLLVERSLEQPRGITLDGDTLYWVDSLKDTVEAVNIDGSGRRIVVVQTGTNLFGLATYGKYLFLTEQSKGQLKIVDKNNGSLYISYRLGHIPFDIVMYTDYTSGSNKGCEALQCEQMCVQLPDSGPACYCGEGFNITEDGRTCQLTEVFVQPSHIYAVHDSICHYPANVADMSLQNVTLDKQCFLGKGHGYLAITYDARENFLYYSENNTRTISRVNLEVGATAETIAGGTGIVPGLCLDWMTGNLFWTDATNQLIKVANKHGIFQRVLISTNLDNPLGIAVHPARGRLYFTDPGVKPKVETCFTDGSDRRTIISENLGSPNHIYIDYTTDKLYWADSVLSHVRCYDLNSGRITVIFSQENTGFFGISLFKDMILWTDREEMNGIHMARLDKEEKVRGIIHPSYGIAHDLITFDINNQPAFNSSCGETDSPCQQLCLLQAEGTPVCSCGLGYTLSDDFKSCITEVVDNNFLLVTDAYQRQVFQIKSSNGVVNAVYHGTRHSPIALGFHPFKMRVFWSDNTAHVIKASTLSGDKSQVILGMEGGAVVDGLAVDHINDLLYYTDAGQDLIGVLSLNNYTLKKALITENLAEPRGIALLPLEGVLYWSDWGTQPRIERASMDGSGRAVFLSLEKNCWPNGLTVDVKSRRLFWVDAQENTVSMIYLNGTGRRVMLKEDVAHYFDITLMGDYLYMTDWKRTYITRMHKDGGALEEFGTESFTKLYGIYGYNRTEILRGNSMCQLRQCHHLCLPRPHNLVTCHCMHGYHLASDRRICVQDSNQALTTSASVTVPSKQTTSQRTSSSDRVTLPTAQNTTIIAVSSAKTTLLTTSVPASLSFSPILSTDIPSPSTQTTTVSVGSTRTDSANTSSSTDKNSRSWPPVRKSQGMSRGVTAAIAVVVLVAIILLLVVAVVLYKKHKGYKIPHGKLLEDDNQHVDTFYRITFPDNNKDEPVMLDNGIENPAYDRVTAGASAGLSTDTH